SNEVDALRIFREYGVDYLLVHFGYFVGSLSGDEGKWVWMVRIASDYYPDINESDYIDENGPTEKFFDSLIYKTLFYKEPGTYDFAPQVSQQMDKLGYPKYEAYPSSSRWEFIGSDSQYPLFDETYISSNYLVKIYKLNYTILDMSLRISNSSSYTFDDKTVALLTVENNGTVPITVDTSPYAVTYNGSTIHSLSGSVSIAEGSAHLTPGETVTLKVDLPFNSTLSSELPFEVQSADYYGYIKASSSPSVRSAGSIDFTLSNAKAYSNETVYLTIENTGEEYITITDILLNGTSSGLTIDGDLTLAPIQLENYTITIDRTINPSLDLNISDIITIDVNTWEGVSKQVSAVVVQQPPGYSFILENVSAFSNETILLDVNNNGTYSIDLSELIVTSPQGINHFGTTYFVPLNGTGTTVPAGTTIRYLVNWDPSILNLNQSDTLNITLTTYEDLSDTATNVVVNEPPGYDYTITGFEPYDNETIYLTVYNNGSYPITLADIYVNNSLLANISALNGTLEIAPGSITSYVGYLDPFSFNLTKNDNVNTTITIFADINRTASTTVLDSNYSILVDTAQTYVYDNNTLIITVNNTSPSYTVNNITIYVYNSTSGENETLLWTVSIDAGDSKTSSQLTLTSMNLNAGQDVEIWIKSTEGASYKVTETVLTS
ncbi:MAG: hypothetical protein ACTSQY_02545, partial [Candidatus Odinarchaeia archaeon]